MDQINWSGVLIALIGVISAWFSARAARNSAKFSADASMANERAKAETDAYERARSMDLKTIERQDEEIAELIDKVKSLEADNRELHKQNDALRSRVTMLEGRRRHG